MDVIERQAAIGIVNCYAEQLDGYIGMPNDSEVYAYARGLLLSIHRNISALPPAQPEQKRVIKPVFEENKHRLIKSSLSDLEEEFE